MKHIIKDNQTGVFFNVNDSEDLKAKAVYVINHPEECERMGENAYKEYINKYTANSNYEMLMRIYKEAIRDVKNR